ncbi:MAG: gamma-glutamyl-gamma-aminobutyrate hydrolase family protein [Acidobacteria bacterium]|nr:gamma-glutamyl-gamma-aminobutyrate hydrolase family protein [Acidobacteriota bacterium]MCA1610462.1 gamma-glutamyl-gamma-aminobutyrate hydrolase family protein [Acidobacteriota bacterium]
MRIALTLDRDVAAGESNDYVRSLLQAGFIRGEIEVLQPGTDPRGGFDGVVLGGGCDVDPARYGERLRPEAGVELDAERDVLDFGIFEAARRDGVPILAICRGLQVVNVALGGTLVQDIPTETSTALRHDTTGGDKTRREHEITVAPGSRLASIAGAASLDVNSRHHQAIGRPAEGLVASGRSADGLIEAAELPADDSWLVAVQWHPENLAPAGDSASRRLFAEFAREVRARARASAPDPAASIA